MLDDNSKKVLLISLGVILMLFSATAATNLFSINIFGQPQLDSVTLIAGENITLSQDTTNKTITINSSGDGINQTTNFSYVNNTFLPLVGGNMSGKINMTNNQINLDQMFIMENNKSIGTFRAWDASAYSIGGNFYAVNRKFNTTSMLWELLPNPFGSYSGASFALFNDIFYYTTFSAGNTTGTVRMTGSESGDIILTNGLTINSLSGLGNAYACIDSAGKLFRGNPGC